MIEPLEISLKHGIHDFHSFIEQTPVPQADNEYFATIPHLRHYLKDTNYRAAAFYSLYTKPNDPTSDLFFAKTIRSMNTIPHTLMFLKTNSWDLPSSPSGPTKSRPFLTPDLPDVTILFDLKEGMNGFAHIAHGGSMCSLLDETQGMCAEFHRQLQFRDQKTTLYTAQLNTSFLAPVQTPNVIRVKAWLVSAEGRKWRLRAQLDDGHGKVLMECESLWISTREEGKM
jgi:acyl-coenzyme A thioesterase PaaI-like protein